MTLLSSHAPPAATPSTAVPPSAQERTLLIVFAGYRALVAMILLGLFLMERPHYLGAWHPRLFLASSLAYIAIALGLVVAAVLDRARRRWQVYLGVVTDLTVIGCLTFASGGAASGLGLLMLAPVAGAGLLIPGRHSLFFAALGTLLLLGFEAYGRWYAPNHGTAFSQAGIVGAVLFAVALLASGLAERARRSEVLASERGADLEHLSQLSQEVVDQMSQGVIVVDADERIRLMNQAAWQLLDADLDEDTAPLLRNLSWPLHRLVERYGKTHDRYGPDSDTLQGLIVQMKRIHTGAGREYSTILYLEDAEHTRKQVQETKLAALGQLTANIAHEIRNPLGAISHAAQLLHESEGLDPGDRRLVAIIHEQAQRMNGLIHDVLHLSRRDAVNPEVLELGPWLREFAAEFTQHEGVESGALNVVLPQRPIRVRFDPEHLRRVLWNLCTNAVAHAQPDGRHPVHLVLGGPMDTGAPFIDVIDQGPGVPPEHQQRLFEPFFTTRDGGTGLGLYIARQLCERNGARLQFIPQPAEGSCFRLQFPVRRLP